MAAIISSAGGLVAIGLIVFTVVSHALTFIAQVFKDIGKSTPGWLDMVTNWIAKILDLLNGAKAKA